MYTFYLDDNVIYYPGDPECIIKDPTIELTVGEAGSCEFLLPPENPYYNSLRLRQSMIRVKRDNKEIFCGEVRECPKDNNNIRHVYAVNLLSCITQGSRRSYMGRSRRSYSSGRSLRPTMSRWKKDSSSRSGR